MVNVANAEKFAAAFVMTPLPSPSSSPSIRDDLLESESACGCGAADHVVQFYEEDEFLVQAVGEHLCQGLKRQGRALAIATPAHLAGIADQLERAGFDLEDLRRSRRYVALDAAETLGRFSRDRTPDRELFERVIAGLVGELTAEGEPLFAFGEMVALLCADGMSEEALGLESWWNQLAEKQAFKLLCAYPLKGFASVRRRETFSRICRAHARTLPTESWQGPADLTDGQLRKIAMLQQRAAALEAEMREREHAEQLNRHLAAIVEGSDDAIVSKDLEGIVTSWNPAAERMFGYLEEEIVGRSIVLLIPEERREEERMILSRLRQGGRMRHYETVRRRKDGRLIEVSLSISPVRDASGKIVGASKIARDITERNAAAKALGETRDALERANDTLERQVTDLRRLQELSSKVYATAGRQAMLDEVLRAAMEVGQTDKGLLSLVDARRDGLVVAASAGFSAEFLEMLRFVPSGAGACGCSLLKRERVVVEDVARDARCAPYREEAARAGVHAVHSTPLITRDGSLLGVLSVHFSRSHHPSERETRLMDVYARNAADALENLRLREELERELDVRRATAEELRLANDRLEERVRERTASLTDMLAQMEAFSYTVSHDLRAPLRSMAGFAAILKEDYSATLPAPGRKILERIIRASERMGRMINEVLAYARMSQDRFELAPISLGGCIEQVIEHAEELKSPRAFIRVGRALPVVRGNEALLTQVFANLLGNAVKFVPPGRTPEVEIVATREGPLVRIEISDNGIGVGPEQQGRLFGLFERVHIDKRYDGTGIGLAIVRRAVERMGGTVGMRSSGEGGSCFWLTLAAVDASPAALSAKGA